MADASHIVEYFPERRGTDSSVVAWYVFLSPGVVLVLVGLVARDLAWPAAIATAVAMVYWKRRARRVPQAVLEVRNGRLLVTDRFGERVLDVPLQDVKNVVLDTKVIQRVQENLSSGMPDLRFIDSRVGPSIDTSRIQILHGEESLLLNEDYTSSIDANEWFSKIRRLLRNHGWKPLDEREPAETA